MIYFILGLIVGLLIRQAQTNNKPIFEQLKEIKERITPTGKTQFVEPVTFKQRYDAAETIDDLFELKPKKD